MTRRRTSPRSSGSPLRRTLSEVGGLLTIWGWIAARVSLGLVESGVNRGFALVLSTVVGSEQMDPDALEWSLRNVVDGGGVS